MTESKDRSIPYMPGLDGLRAIALIPMMLFHLEFSGVPGGFLGVSLFFTLSGYLITQLLVREMSKPGGVALAKFWGRRIRRLVPASAVALSVVIALSVTVRGYATPSTRGDLVAGIANMSNWRFVKIGSSYDDIFLAKPSPLLHFWSLAVEEQFYLVLPVIAALTARFRPAIFRAVLIVLAGLSLAATFLTKPHTLIYYGTHTRAFELLAGAMLAFVLPLSKPIPALVSRISRVVSIPALAGFAVLTTVSSSTDTWPYRGGLQVFTLMSFLLIISVCTDTPVRWLASTKPFVIVGQMSYGIYALHWPLFRLLTSERTHVSGVPLAIVRLCATGVAALISYHLIEIPIRERRLFATPRIGLAGYATIAASIVAVSLIVPGLESRTPVLAGVGVSNVPVLFDAPPVTVATALAGGGPGAAAGPGAGPGAGPAADAGQGRVVVVEPRTATTVSLPQLNVLLLGSQPQIADSLASLGAGRYTINLDNRSKLSCPFSVIGYAEMPAGCVPTIDLLSHRQAYDLVIVGTGETDRLGLPGDTTLANPVDRVLGYDLIEPTYNILNTVTAGGVPVVFVDRFPDDALGQRLRDLDDSNPTVSLIVGADPTAALSTLIETQTKISQHPAAALKVLVVGDSTSFGIGSALARSSDGRLTVLWGGGQNCPTIAVVELRWWKGAQWNLDRCPTPQRSWPDLVSGFQPDIVLIVASLPEQADQRYVADGPWYRAGDSEFIAAHNAGMRDLQQLLAASGTLTIVVNAPAIVAGSFAASAMATPTRIAAWNQQITSWAEQWNSVATVDWASGVAAAEAGGAHRPDGLHFEQSDLDAIVRKYLVEQVITSTAELMTAAQATGCLTATHTLDLAACAKKPLAGA